MKKVSCILLVDDNDADNEFHHRAIRKAEICDQVQIATSGEDALSYLEKCGDGSSPRPDLIFLDINMPGMNGFEFLEEYSKLDAKLKSKMVVCMLSSSLLSEDNDRAMNSGEVSAFLTKPLTVETVREVVEKWF